MKLNIYIGSDHSGIEYKEKIIQYFSNRYNFIDLGTNSSESVNYVDFGFKVSIAVKKDTLSLGIVLCGTGIGISIASNKVKGIRCALLYNNQVSKLAKEHNNANVIAFGVREYKIEAIIEMIEIFLDTKFAKERHLERINSIDKIENN